MNYFTIYFIGETCYSWWPNNWLESQKPRLPFRLHKEGKLVAKFKKKS